MYYENSKDNDVELVKNAHFDTYKFREENGKVYLKGLEPYPEQLEILLIDMTPSSGEPVNCISYDYVTGEPSITESKVLKIDSIRVNDIIRKRITFPPNQFNSGNDETNYWVEGIGSTNLFITNGAVPLPSRAYSYKFIGCYDGDNCIFTLDDFQAPVVSSLPAMWSDAEKPTGEAEYFNLQGIKVTNPQPGQIYIRRQGTHTEKLMIR